MPPLLVICGIPGSGKTTRATELKTYLEKTHEAEVEIVSEDSLKLDKNLSYSGKPTKPQEGASAGAAEEIRPKTEKFEIRCQKIEQIFEK